VASVSVSHLILFIASMLVAASVAGVFTDTVGQLSGAIDDQGLQISEDVRTDVEIISDSGSSAVYDDGTDTTTIHVKNTGTETLAATSGIVDVFVDGRFETDVTVTLLGDASSWRSGEVVRMEIEESLTTGEDHRIKLVVNGDEEIFRFRAES